MIRLSTRQKREVYSLSSMVLHLIVFVIILITLNSCTDENLPQISYNVPATVQDMRGLDGCGFVLVLEDGQRLQAVYANQDWCGTLSASNKLNPQEKFSFTDGQKVIIAYKESSKPSICMAGQTVEITCIRNFDATESSISNS